MGLEVGLLAAGLAVSAASAGASYSSSRKASKAAAGAAEKEAVITMAKEKKIEKARQAEELATKERTARMRSTELLSGTETGIEQKGSLLA